MADRVEGEEDDEAPAPGWRRRRTGFTAKKRGIYLEALAKYGTIADACRAAGISTTTAARHERKDADFRSLCRAARARAAASLETFAWERGVTGIEEEVFHYGKVVGKRVKRSDAVFRMILMAADPERYGRQGAVARAAIEKDVEARLRPRIEAELLADTGVASNEEVRAALIRAMVAHGLRAPSGAGEDGADRPDADGNG